MTDEEFFAELETLGISSSHFCLTGGLPPDKLCIDEQSGSWRVYFSERGNRMNETSHPTREAALDELMNRARASARYLTQPPTKGGVKNIHGDPSAGWR